MEYGFKHDPSRIIILKKLGRVSGSMAEMQTTEYSTVHIC